MSVEYYGTGGSNSAVPIGSIVRFPYTIGSSAGTGNIWTAYPSGFLPCDGRALFKTDYPELAELVGDSAGLPINTDGGVVATGSQITSGFALGWSTQTPKNVRVYSSRLLLPIGKALAHSNDNGTSWTVNTTQIGATSAFRSKGSPVVSGSYAYVGGDDWLNSTGIQTGAFIYKFPVDGSLLAGSPVTGTIGAGGVQTTVCLGAKAGVIYITITSGADAGKIFKSADAGDTWTFVQNTSTIYSSIDLDSIWYVASRGVFVFDGVVSGVTGTHEIDDFESGSTATLATSLRTSNGITFDGTNYWFTSGGQLYKTTNFVTITAVGNVLPISFNGYVSFGANKIFVGGNTGYYSVDTGVTWNTYIADGGNTELPFGCDLGKSLFGMVNRGDDNAMDIYKLKLAESSGLTFNIPTLATVDGETRCMKVSA